MTRRPRGRAVARKARAAMRAAAARVHRRRLAKLDTWTTTHGWFVNLDNHRRDQDQLAAELRALASDGPLFIGCCETAGNRLPQLAGYKLTRGKGRPGRANLALYVHDHYPAPRRRRKWTDLHATWPRTKAAGTHPARSILTQWLDRMPLHLFHAPPRYPAQARAAQPEHHAALVELMAPAGGELGELRPQLAVGDVNSRAGEREPGVDDLARAVRGTWHGSRIDAAATRGQVVVHDVSYWHELPGGVRFRGDHGHVLRLVFSTPQVWLRKRRRHRRGAR